LSPWTLRFFKQDFERFYIEHHWAHMRYWLWLSVFMGLFYSTISVVFGDELIAEAFDVRMDHYTRTSLIEETPAWLKEAAENATKQQFEEQKMLWNDVKVINLVDGKKITIPRVGFLAWHVTWSLLFLMILLVDRFHNRCCSSRRVRWVWAFARTWLAFGVMFLDVVITSFLNPSVTRFMLFVYALLIRAQFVQTVILVFITTLATLGAGFIGSHDFLNSISVAEFLILNLVCLSAARQTEIHARLSVYRLWYIMTKSNSSGMGDVQENISEAELARNVLSLNELTLEPILEDSALETENFGPPPAPDEMEDGGNDQESGVLTPSSYTVSIGSCAHEPTANQVTATKNSRRGIFSRHLIPDVSRGRSGRRRVNRKRSGSISPSQSSDSETDNLSDCASFCSEQVMDQTRLPPWLCHVKEGIKQCASNDMDATSCWAEVQDVDRYELRGPDYLTDHVKLPATPCAFAVHQIRIIKTKDALLHAGANESSLSSFLKSHPKFFFFIYNRIVPIDRSSVMNVITLMVRRLPSNEDETFDRLLNKYVTGDETFRNNRLKYLYKIRDAPSAVHMALRSFGKERPVIIGNKGHMDQQNYTGSNYVEVDIDTSSSWLARMVVGKINSNAAKIVIEEMLVLEGQEPGELPERPLASWRWVHLNPEQSLVDFEASPPQRAASAAGTAPSSAEGEAGPALTGSMVDVDLEAAGADRPTSTTAAGPSPAPTVTDRGDGPALTAASPTPSNPLPTTALPPHGLSL
jgi:hypothetical protein